MNLAILLAGLLAGATPSSSTAESSLAAEAPAPKSIRFAGQPIALPTRASAKGTASDQPLYRFPARPLSVELDAAGRPRFFHAPAESGEARHEPHDAEAPR